MLGDKLIKITSILALICASAIANASQINPTGTGIFINLSSEGTTVLDNFWVTPDADTASINEKILPTIGNQTIGDVGIGWEVSYDPDPFLFAQFTVTNLSSSAKAFSLGSLVPINPAFASGYYGGSLDATLEDTSSTNGIGITGEASLTHGAPGAYKGNIDGTTVLNLFAIDMSCNSGPGCITTASDTDGLGGDVVNFGDPLPHGVDNTLLALGPSNNIGIDLDFTLSAGDTITFDAYFEVVPVPLPAAAWLFISALVSLATFRKTGQGLNC